MQKLFKLILGLLLSFSCKAQTDSLLMMLQTDTAQKTSLLPARMVFTQRFLWGEKGLMRTWGKMPLNDANREKELKIRRTMLVAHQVDGFVTLGLMVAQGIVGARLYSYPVNTDFRHDAGYRSIRNMHQDLGLATDITYFSTACLALFAPPPLINRKTKKTSSTTLHKYLAMIHFPAMVATNILAGYARHDTTLKALHRDAAYTAFASFGLAVLVMKF